LARAEGVARILQQESTLSENLFTVLGHGGAKQVADNKSEQGRAENRRVEIRVLLENDPVSLSQTPQKGPDAKEATVITEKPAPPSDKMNLSFRNLDFAEAFEMLAKKGRVNIIVEKEVSGEVSLNLFDVQLEEAIQAVARSGGYGVEKSETGYLVYVKGPVEPVLPLPVPTQVRTFKIQYADSEKIEKIASKLVSEKGTVNVLKERELLIVEDTLSGLDKIENLLQELDKEPKQILIEAKILEITLDETESFGLDWWKIFTEKDSLLGVGENGSGSVGVRGLSNASSGFIFNLVNRNVNITLNALNEKGRVKTLSTPKLLTVENKRASVIIGDRKGYAVTTTIDQVTTESFEFLESGIILHVIPKI